MIENIDRINKIMPLGTNLYYNNGNVDALYGPYKAPDDNLYFEYNGKRFPENDYFETKLEYVKELSKFYLTQKGSFNLGRKVLLIDDNNNPIEYTVAYNSNQQLELITSDELEIYTIRFNSLDAEGAMIEYKVYGDFFNLPESKFIAPKYVTISGIRDQIFMGWRICNPSTNSEIKFEFSDKVYSVYELINLSEHFYFKDDIKIVDLYTEYVIPEEVTVDFEPIVYETEIIDSTTQPNENFSTYIKLEQYSNGDTFENIKPDDWDYNYKSYFVKDNETNYDTYQEISYEKVYKLENKEDYLDDSYEWKSDNFKTWYGEENWEGSQSPVLYKDLISLNENGPEYVWIKSNNFMSLIDYGVMRYIQRKWYKRIQKNEKMVRYISCSSSNNWDEYKNKDLYSHVIVNKLSMFSNGQLYGDVLYDTFDAGLITANTGSTIQISSEMKEPYKTKYMFDHWLIEVYDTIDASESRYEHEYTTSTATFIFDDIKDEESSSDKYCNYYKIKAIYKKRPTYCKLFLTTNSNNENLLGNTCIYGMVKNKNIRKVDINPGELQINDSISIETRVKLCEITSTGEYKVIENTPGVNIETIASLWGDGNNTTYFKIDTERYPTIQIVGEPDIIGKVTPNKPLFYKWTGCIENTSNTIDLSLVIGGIYELKSWFCYDGDLMAKVRVLKYTGTQDIPEDITVGVYDWKNEELTITDGKININNDTNTNVPKQYLISTQKSIFDKNPTTQINKKYITGMTYTSVNKPNINTLPLLNLGSNRRVIDLATKLDDNTGVAYIDIDNVEKSNGCYIVVDIPQNSNFNFDGWNDNSTNYQIENITENGKTYNRYIRYVEVNSTDLYTFVAILSKKIIHTINNETTPNIPTIKDMANELKTKFSGVKNTKLFDSNRNTNDIIKGKIGNSLSLGGAIYQGKGDALKNNKKVKVILSDVTEEEATETIIIDVNDDITSLDTETTEPTEVLNESPVIKEIINVTTQNVGKIEINNDTDTSNYDENFNKIVSKTTRTFNTPQMSLNLNNNIKNNI